jgi:RNA recognition motif-containing protein
MENSWSDFVATPPGLGSASQFLRFGEFYDQIFPPPQDYYITEDQVSDVFAPPEQSQRPLAPLAINFPPQFSAPPAPEFSEIENRAILISNLDPQTTQAEIEKTFCPTDSVKSIDLSALDTGAVTIDYYSLKTAMDLKQSLNGEVIRGSSVSISFAPLPKIEDMKKPPNNGTIVVFHLPNGVTQEQIHSAFSQFGDIRQIRGTPSKPTQRFIEYWDIRGAEKALDGLNGKYVMGSRVSIEFSLPGGFRRNVQRGNGGGRGAPA